MKNFNYDTDDLIVALATPWAESALAIVRTSGQGSIEKTAEIFSNKNDVINAKHNSMNYGFLLDSETGEKLDPRLFFSLGYDF